MPFICHSFLKEFIYLYLSIRDMLSHVVIEVVNLLELGRADGAHIGGPFLAAGLSSNTHTRPDAGTHTRPSAHRHGQSHHTRPGLGHCHGHGDGHRAGRDDSVWHTHHRAPGAVQRHVTLQQRLVGELLLTDVAFVGLLSTVQPHVHVERALLGEALVADAALVGAHPCVCHHVFD